ncbi:MAG: hypothetical protein JO126_07565 [Alphaproteobacteria bacterium]|nr:hypothetical protein [Alphaproteobacteria bacterium]
MARGYEDYLAEQSVSSKKAGSFFLAGLVICMIGGVLLGAHPILGGCLLAFGGIMLMPAAVSTIRAIYFGLRARSLENR